MKARTLTFRRGLLLFWVVGIPVPFSQVVNKFHAFFIFTFQRDCGRYNKPFTLTLFPDEQIVAQPNAYVTLTTHRIWNQKSGVSKTVQQSIMLEHITSCESRYISYFLLLVIAIACGVAAVLLNNDYTDEATAPFALAAVLFLVLFFVIRPIKVIISSPSMKMYMSLTGLKRPKVHEFINAIEQTKQKRLDSLKPSV